jgi:sulfatase maturation enzyme AslB (radical SAM superfamily)
MRVPPRIVVLKLSSICMLACRMCHPTVSTGIRRFWDADLERLTGDRRGGLQRNRADLEVLRSELRQIAPYLSQISFSGGEPFADPNVLEILSDLKLCAPSLRVYINTSLASLTFGSTDVLSVLQGYAQKVICVSVDGPPLLHQYTRPGLDLQRFVENLDRLRRDPSIEIHSNTAVYALNCLYFAETADFVLRRVRPARFNVSLSTKPGLEHMDARTLPRTLRATAIAKLMTFRAHLVRSRGLPPVVLADVNEALTAVTALLQVEGMSTDDNLSRLASYFRKLDQVHGTSLAEVCPEVAAVLEQVPEFRGTAPVRSGPTAGMPE